MLASLAPADTAAAFADGFGRVPADEPDRGRSVEAADRAGGRSSIRWGRRRSRAPSGPTLLNGPHWMLYSRLAGCAFGRSNSPRPFSWTEYDRRPLDELTCDEHEILSKTRGGTGVQRFERSSLGNQRLTHPRRRANERPFVRPEPREEGLLLHGVGGEARAADIGD